MLARNLARTVACAISLVAAQIAAAQPETPPPGAEQQPETVRARVQSRLDRARESMDRLEKLLSRLDAGEKIDPAELNELMMDRPFRDRFGEGGADWRGAGPREGAPGAGIGGPGLGVGAGPGGLGRSEQPPQIPAEEVEKFVKENLPWLDDRLNRIGTERPELRQQMLNRLTPQIVEIMQLRHDDPEMARLRTEQFRLGADWMDASRRIREQLRDGTITQADAVSAFTELAERHFDLRQQITRHEIDRLRGELAGKERELNDDDAKREEWIHDMAQRMVDRLTRMRGPRGPEDSEFERGRGRGPGPDGRGPAEEGRGNGGGRP